MLFCMFTKYFINWYSLWWLTYTVRPGAWGTSFLISLYFFYLGRSIAFPTRLHMRPVKSQISQRIYICPTIIFAEHFVGRQGFKASSGIHTNVGTAMSQFICVLWLHVSPITYIWSRGYKTFFSLGHKNKNTKNLKLFSCSTQLSLLSWVEHERSFKILSILRFINKKKSCSAELSMKKVFITWGPALCSLWWPRLEILAFLW